MLIKNALVFETQGQFTNKDIAIEGEIFTNNADGKVIDAAGLIAIPGLTDIHFHGCNGYDFSDATEESILQIAKYELSQGITTICPATMTLPEEMLFKISTAAKNYNKTDGAELVGINMEGPFISAEKKGAHNPNYIRRPDADLFNRLQEASGGLYKLVSLAPEKEGAMSFIETLKDKVRISLAHSMADYDTADTAFKKGALHVTHLYNAMPPFSHRAPGIIGAACDHEDITVELICDGIHIHPAVIRSTFKLFGGDRIILISDSMRATGLKNGQYTLGGQTVTVVDHLATLAGSNVIAGSAAHLMDCLRFTVQKVGIPLATAVKCVTVNPAKAIGIFDHYGSITPGKYADLLLLDKDLQLVKIIKKGQIC